jgi:hypothetical protein
MLFLGVNDFLINTSFCFELGFTNHLQKYFPYVHNKSGQTLNQYP